MAGRCHAALADAANKAAADGKFSRAPSTSTTRSDSGVSKADVEDNEQHSRDNRSQYSLTDDDEDDAEPTLTSNSILPPADPNAVMDSTAQHPMFYNAPDLNFDFGFDTTSMDEVLMDSDFDPSGDDDDIVAGPSSKHRLSR